MQVSSSVNARYYTSYQTNKSVKYCAGFSPTEDGKLIPNETTENPGFAEFVDYQEFHKAWMSQGAETAFSYTRNEGFNAEANSISLVPGMSVRLSNGFRLAIGDYMVQALGNFKDNQAASESAVIAGALSHLIKVANGQIPMNMFYSKNQDNSAYAKIGLEAFGIDTSRPFTINGRTFHFDSDEQIRLGSGQHVDEEYQVNTVSEDVETKNEETVKTDIDFSRFAPNAPEEVRKAFREAAEETGYYEYSGKGKMNYISQILVRQVENRQNGVANYTDVFGGSVASALQAAREMLYDLENPLMPDNQRSEDIIKYREQEKEFYRTFIAKLEGVTNTGNVLDTQERIENCISARYATASTKENPIVEVSLQIGGETITHEINISEVNPRKATQLEMYAFFYHQDMVSGKGGENTYQKFSEYVENAVQNGHFEGNQSYGDFTEKEHDWQKVIISMWEDYSDAGLYSQMQECIKLNETMEKASIQFVDFDKITLVNKSSEVFFTYTGMNVPKQLRVAWMESAGAMEDTEKYGHLTRVLYRRIEAELEGKDLQDEAGVIDAAIEAVKKALQDLEETPTDAIANNPDTKKEMQELKDYYQAFMQKLEALKENSAESTEATDEETAEDITFSYQEFFAMYMEQIFIKIQNGDTEATYQIGSQSFTEKEWETFLEKFDSVEEAIQELIKEEQARKEAEEVKQENELTGIVSAGNDIDDDALLTAETTSCKYETANPDDDDILYVTFYTADGIRCKKLRAEDFEWTLTFENKEQYNKVMEFLGNFPSDWNMRFAAHQNFWNDFLNDEVDMDGFMEFLNGTNKGVPDFSITAGDSMYIDKDKMQWAKYTNPLDARFYTAEEMYQMQAETIAANQAKLTKLTDSYGEVYKQNHPDYNGERIFCEYPGGPLYTADEIGRLKWEQFLAESFDWVEIIRRIT